MSAVAAATTFGLANDDVRRLVEAVTPGIDIEDDWPERFARAAWTTLAEPGDSTAGALVAAIGASAALELVLERASATSNRSAVDAGLAPAADIASLDPALDPTGLASALARWVPRLSAVSVVRSLEQAARFGIRCSTPDDAWWPHRLDDLGPSAPIALWTRGDPERLSTAMSSIAIVGARAATGYGEHVAVELAAGLGDRGIAVISGGAYGIDGAAHRAALAGGSPTVAVLAGGLDRPYPSGHEALFHRIAADGLLAAEVPCGVPPTKWRFLQRNRVIAAASAATIVVEAGYRSGSLNTAGHAAAIGRPLGAVPGAVTSAASAGCHRLMREYDATCITTAAEALELLGVVEERAVAADERTSAAATRVLDALHRRHPRTAVEVAGLTGMSLGAVLGTLSLLEIDGRIATALDGGWVLMAR